ncbi:MAG TPA: hypothetical protein VN282_25035 [Pyrinomonadaceae bacterium]|nr:hypothetical protein [Pyrinomonadaceae bacterium]
MDVKGEAAAAREFKEGAGPGSLWAGILAGPLAALVQLQANYALVLWVCGTGRAWSLHAVSAAALAVAVGAGLLSRRNWRRAGADWDDGGAGVLPRSRFMAAVGMLLSAHSALVVVAQWIAVFVYSACQRT